MGGKEVDCKGENWQVSLTGGRGE